MKRLAWALPIGLAACAISLNQPRYERIGWVESGGFFYPVAEFIGPVLESYPERRRVRVHHEDEARLVTVASIKSASEWTMIDVTAQCRRDGTWLVAGKVAFSRDQVFAACDGASLRPVSLELVRLHVTE